MPLDIKTSTQGKAQVISLIGSLDGSTVNAAQETIMPQLTGKTGMVLDMKGCTYVSSAGLRLLLMAAKQVTAQGGLLALSGLCPEIKDVMEMTGFSGFFKSFDTAEAAVAAVSGGV